MFKAISLVVGFAAMQSLQVVGTDASGGSPPEEGDVMQAADSVTAPALRIVQVVEVTDGTTNYMQPIWSPDGRKLAFTKSGFTGVYVRNADGSGRIQEITSADYSGYQPVWTSDSKGIVVRTRTGIVGQSIGYIEVETGEATVLEERAAHPKQPERNVYGDVTIDVDGQAKVLDNSTASLESRDGYYSPDRPASRDLRLERDDRDSGTWVVIEGDGTRRMEFPHRALLAGLSTTRDRVAFLQGDGNLHVSRLDGSGKVSLGRGSGDWDWSPDGKSIVYVGAEEDNGYITTASELFVANSGTGGVTQLTYTPDIVETFPRWSPDGMRIAYSSVNTGRIYAAILGRVHDDPSGLTQPAQPESHVEGRIWSTAEFDSLPRSIGGVELEITVYDDTLLMPVPVLVEMRLRNTGSQEVLEPCLLNPMYGFLKLYAVLSDSTAVHMVPDVLGDMVGAWYLRLKPGQSFRTLLSIGSDLALYGGTPRGDGTIEHMYFNMPGTFAIFATYERIPSDYFDEVIGPLGRIVSNVDTFVVEQPGGTEAAIAEQLGSSLSEERGWDLLRAVFSDHPSSAYAPFAQARYASAVALGWVHDQRDNDEAVRILEDLISRYPEHPLAEAAEFAIVTHYHSAGKIAEANQRMDSLLIRYPENVRSYEMYMPDGTGIIRPGYGVRDPQR